MKKLMLIIVMFFGIALSNIEAKSIFHFGIDINVFYGALQPYGEWIDVGYDEYVWRPIYVDRYWRPYSDGRWEWTRHGWYWVSYEPFGWATYHYGRWFFDDYYGWVWMPDDEWGPSWVEWRYDNYYIGWAPLPPYARFNQRSGIFFSMRWNSHYTHWNFVTYKYFRSDNIHNYYVKSNKVKSIFGRTKYRTNYYAESDRIINGGVSRDFVEKKMGKKFTTREIVNSSSRDDYERLNKVRNGKIVDYRPEVKEIEKNNFDRDKIVKGRSLEKLQTDKVELRRNKVSIERNNENNLRKKSDSNLEELEKSKESRKTKIIEKTNKPERKPEMIYKSNAKIKKQEVEKNINNANKKLEKKSKSEIKGRSTAKENIRTSTDRKN